MRSKIYIFGAGGLGREVYCLLQDMPEYEVVAFVENDRTGITKITANGKSVDVITETTFLQICANQSDINAVIAIANSNIKEHIFDKFSTKCLFPNIIHPSTKITGLVTFGIGNLVAHNNIFTDNIAIGNFNLFNTGISVGHDAVICDYNVIMPSCNISGEVNIGSKNMIGARSFILQGLTIGSENSIGAGSVVLRKLGNSTSVFGVPAKKIDI